MATTSTIDENDYFSKPEHFVDTFLNTIITVSVIQDMLTAISYSYNDIVINDKIDSRIGYYPILVVTRRHISGICSLIDVIEPPDSENGEYLYRVDKLLPYITKKYAH